MSIFARVKGTHVIAVACLGLGLACLVYTGVSYKTYQETYTEQLAQIGDLESNVSQLEKTSGISKKEVEVRTHTATEAGQAVADQQNEYGKLSGMSQNDQIDRTHKIAGELDKYFAEEDKNARAPWYMPPRGTNATWTFASTYAFNQDGSKVIWVCRDKTGKLLAYTLADYNTKDKTFSQVSKAVTVAGAELIEPTGDNGDRLQGLIKDMETQTKKQGQVQVTDEDRKALAEINAARDKMREERGQG